MKWTPKNILRLRIAIGIGQEEFADRLGVTRAAISNYERGDRKPSKPVKMLLDNMGRRHKWRLETAHLA